MAMRIESGCRVFGDGRLVDGDSVRIVAEDGRDLFQIKVGSDGHSIEVRGIGTVRAGDTLYCERFDVRPQSANCVVICARRYDER